MSKRNAQGAGTIRKKTVTRKGKEYSYWEARITVGRDPGTGKQIQRSFTGKTQKEVREKLQAVAVEVNAGTYITPQKMTVGEWLDTWSAEYTSNLKPGTVNCYKGNIKNHIFPALGAVKLSELHPHTVQAFINSLTALSPSSIRLIYKVLHMALEKAVMLEYIPKNPSSGCVLPKTENQDIKPLDDTQTAALLNAAQGEYRNLITVALFTGLRRSELLGLTWECIDFSKGTITVNKQLASSKIRHETIFHSPKNGRTRTLTVAPSVMAALKKQKQLQAIMRSTLGELWSDPFNLVFTDDDGACLDQNKLAREFKKILRKAGLPNVRFHDLRHTYAVNAIRAGDDIKSIQGNLGHATAAFTLDRYGHFTERMKQESASRMEHFMKGIFNL